MTEKLQSLQEKVLGAIQRKEVAMRPRWHFVLRSVLVVLGIVIIALLSVYLVSLVVFLMKQSGGWFGPEFGPRGVRAFLFSAPWLLVGASLVFIVFLEILARRTEVARRTPMLYSAVGVIAIVALGTFIVDRAAVHPFLADRARGGDMPMMREFYRSERRDDLRRGVIVGVSDRALVIESPDGIQEQISMLEETRMPPGWIPATGETVVVLGEQEQGEFVVFGIRPVDSMRFERGRMGGMRRGFSEDGFRPMPMNASSQATSVDQMMSGEFPM